LTDGDDNKKSPINKTIDLIIESFEKEDNK
jgi:hypothetical protein